MNKRHALMSSNYYTILQFSRRAAGHIKKEKSHDQEYKLMGKHTKKINT